MISLSGYLYPDSDCDTLPEGTALAVISCGHYILKTKQLMLTRRPGGRRDYQLLYVQNGSARFLARGEYRRVNSGEAVLYCPGEPQEYAYDLEDSPDIYWVHFGGTAAADLLNRCGLAEGGWLPVSVREEYARLFDGIIRELQHRNPMFQELVALYFQELATQMGRAVMEKRGRFLPGRQEVERAVERMHHRFSEPFSLKEYADQCHMSPCWFTRLFHRQTGASPRRYLTGIRLNKARELLASSGFTVGDIAQAVGYPNALYFSRIFKKYVGISPSGYRGLHQPGSLADG